MNDIVLLAFNSVFPLLVLMMAGIVLRLKGMIDDELVPAGETIANFHYYDDNLIPFTVEQDSFLIATRVYPAFNSGDRVAFLGLEWEEL